MAFRNCFTFSLVFLSYFLIMSTLAKSNVVLDIENNLPNDKPGLFKFRCGGDDWFNLRFGDHYIRTAPADPDYECNAIWGRWFTIWKAYDTNEFKGHDKVYWLVKEDGFYRSWEGSNWTHDGNWYTE
ncbi:hypothetical protein TanjilG_20221 [Lupinus angustifolius]|uniref:S-protein homolog n=1 Tax=Lupinus angustifolius TaxID=3871 RepID=A0A1J7G5J0_LUPAN|nr:hypothetical protein TanjilG_20221 [Lupinus angustifolius]